MTWVIYYMSGSIIMSIEAVGYDIMTAISSCGIAWSSIICVKQKGLVGA